MSKVDAAMKKRGEERARAAPAGAASAPAQAPPMRTLPAFFAQQRRDVDARAGELPDVPLYVVTGSGAQQTVQCLLGGDSPFDVDVTDSEPVRPRRPLPTRRRVSARLRGCALRSVCGRLSVALLWTAAAAMARPVTPSAAPAPGPRPSPLPLLRPSCWTTQTAMLVSPVRAIVRVLLIFRVLSASALIASTAVPHCTWAVARWLHCSTEGRLSRLPVGAPQIRYVLRAPISARVLGPPGSYTRPFSRPYERTPPVRRTTTRNRQVRRSSRGRDASRTYLSEPARIRRA